MINDEDRREVARRLRSLRSGWSSGECYYTIIHELELPDTSREDSGAALYARLADLIEPSEPKVKCVAEVWVVVSEPFDLPSEDEFNRDFITSVHGVFDREDAACNYALHLSKQDRTRTYCALHCPTVGDKL